MMNSRVVEYRKMINDFYDKMNPDVKRMLDSTFVTTKSEKQHFCKFVTDKENWEIFINKLEKIKEYYYSIDETRYSYQRSLDYILNDFQILYDHFKKSAIYQYNFSKNEDSDKSINVFIECFSLLGKCIIGEKIPTINQDELLFEELNKKIESNIVFYRGQHNVEWNITPSLLRGVSKSQLIIDSKYLKEHYLELGLWDKYKNTVTTLSKIDYNFLSYMQHACSHSPLIDFTRSPIVATKFALWNTNSFNDFINCDSCIYELKFNNAKSCNNISEIDDFFDNKYKVYYCTEKIEFGKPIKFSNSDQTIYANNFDDLIKLLTPSYKIIKTQTNDRMKYQKGLFIVFYNYLSVNNEIFYTLNSHLLLKKYIIKKEDKKEMLRMINYKYPEYTSGYLMDPYLYFRDLTGENR